MINSRFLRRRLMIDAVILLLALGYFGTAWVAAERLTIPERYHDATYQVDKKAYTQRVTAFFDAALPTAAAIGSQ
jgi:hypothetical protein